uniref:Lipocalin-like domain-containing protein n=1 Tax=Solibacter usitatus (strain Ellin6076) TaxID=234267 RepID=Q01WD1_SOLUE
MPDLKALQGTWKIVSLEMDGSAMPSGEASIIVKGSRFTTTAMGGEYSGAIEVDETTSPKSFNLRFDAGPETGNTSYGIYELSRDSWKICLTLRGGKRPTTFATTLGSGLALETLQRVTGANTKAGKAKSATPLAPLPGEPAPELAGEWSMVSAIMSGKPLEPQYVRMGKRIATASELQVKIGPQAVLKAAYAVERTSAPKAMNYRLADGRVQAGIWELDGRQLRTCFASPGQPRPTEFASARGDGRTFTVWTK